MLKLKNPSNREAPSVLTVNNYRKNESNATGIDSNSLEYDLILSEE